MSYDSEVLLDLPKGYWKFDETSTDNGSTIIDYSGNAKDMLLANSGPYLHAPALRKLLGTRCRYLSGYLQYAYRAYEAFFNLSTVTLEFWGYYPTNIGGYGLCKVQRGGYAQWCRKDYIQQDVYVNGAYLSKSTSFATAEKARHYVTTYDGQLVKLFIDGQKLLEFDNTTPYNITHASSVSLMFGANPSGAASSIDAGGQPQCFVSNVAIYSGALSEARILAHYNAATRLVSVKINDFVTADSFFAVAVDLIGDIVGSSILPSGISTLQVTTDQPVFVLVFPLEGNVWKPSTTYALNDLVFPTNPVNTPYYYKRIASGDSGAAEPTWVSTPSTPIDDGLVVGAWELVSKLSKPVCKGPFIPFSV